MNFNFTLSRLPIIDGPTISEQFIYLSQISNSTHVSWAIRQTEGRAKREIVNMMLNSAYLTSTNAKNYITIFISTHSYRADSINVPCLMLYQS